jgi:hypothetical protein
MPVLHVTRSLAVTTVVATTALSLLLQATVTGFGEVTAEAVFKVCDQPHPKLVKQMLSSCVAADLPAAYQNMKTLCDMGFSPIDIITTVFRVRSGTR